MRQEVRACGIPIVSLVDATGLDEERFGGLEKSDDTVTNVKIVYGGGRPDGPLASVETSRWVGTRVDAGPLRWMVEHHMRLHGDRFSAVEWTERDATVVVDGRRVVGRIVRAGNRWWAARCELGDVEISVVARDWHPDSIAVETVADIEPLLARPRARRRSATRPVPEAVPDDMAREPHRALVDTVLARQRRHREWLADGGPVPQLPLYWSALWDAAVGRHIALTDLSESDAKDAVRSIVDQMSDLQGHAAWFRDDVRLRDRAIAETLLYGTGLSDTVASRPAQQAWSRRRSTRVSSNSAELEAGAAVDHQWLGAWAAWADDQSTRW